MILGQSKRDGGLAAVVVCDVCGQVIDNAGLGAMVFRSRGLGEDELYQVMHVHKGTCHDRAEAKLVGNTGAPWRELTDHLNEVVTSTGLTFDSLVMKEVGWLSGYLTTDQHAAIQERLAAVTELLREYGLASPLWNAPRSGEGG